MHHEAVYCILDVSVSDCAGSITFVYLHAANKLHGELGRITDLMGSVAAVGVNGAADLNNVVIAKSGDGTRYTKQNRISAGARNTARVDFFIFITAFS